MIRQLLLIAALCFVAASPVAASPQKVEAVFTNHGSDIFVLEIFDATGAETGYTTLHPNQSDKFHVEEGGRARIRELNYGLRVGKPVSSCRIAIGHITHSRQRPQFEIRGRKITQIQ